MPYRPFQFEQDGEIVGFDVDMIDLVAQELGVEQQIVDTPFEGIQSGEDLNARKCDIAAAAMTRRSASSPGRPGSCTRRRTRPRGVEVTDPDADIDAIRRRIGMVFQQFNLFPHLTVTENLTIAQRRVLRRGKAEAERVAAVSSSGWRSPGRWRWARS